MDCSGFSSGSKPNTATPNAVCNPKGQLPYRLVDARRQSAQINPHTERSSRVARPRRQVEPASCKASEAAFISYLRFRYLMLNAFSVNSVASVNSC
jgi:hypothetical protein